MAQIEYE
jgi:hypothetical protein